MSKAQEYIKLRDAGMTYRQIGDMYGISKQAVSYSVNSHNASIVRNAEKIKYPNIRKWMIENDCSIKELCRMAGCDVRYPLVNGGNIKKNVIDAVLSVTGLTYEVAFLSNT